MRGVPYIEDPWEIYWDLVSTIWCHYLDPDRVDDITRAVARKCDRDGNTERAVWLRRLVAGEEVER